MRSDGDVADTSLGTVDTEAVDAPEGVTVVLARDRGLAGGVGRLETTGFPQAHFMTGVPLRKAKTRVPAVRRELIANSLPVLDTHHT